MESLENSYENIRESKSSSSEDENLNFKYECLNLDTFSNLSTHQHKDYSIRKNFSTLEKDISLLSSEVFQLRQKNQKLQTKLNIAIHEKEFHIESHAKDVSKLTKENISLKEKLELEKKKFKKENEVLKEENAKLKKQLKKIVSASECKIKKLQLDVNEQRNYSMIQMQQREKEISVMGI